MTEKEKVLIHRTHDKFGRCLTSTDLINDFKKLGIRRGMVILVHSSLSSIGWISGGPVTVIQSLIDCIGPEGTLLMPSFTSDNSEPSDWSDPAVPAEWFEIIRSTMPPYDSRLTPTYRMGRIAETFRHWPAVLRSDHPHCSMLAVGHRAKFLIENHKDSFGDQSPLARLYDCGEDAHVLLLGVSHENNTSLHYADHRFQTKMGSRKTLSTGASVIDEETKKRTWIQWNDFPFDTVSFQSIGKSFDSNESHLRIGFVGLAESRLMKQVNLIDFAVDWMIENRDN